MGWQEDLFNAEIRHAVYVRRLAGGDVKRMLSVLDAADRDLVRKLQNELIQGESIRSRRLQALLDDIAGTRSALWKQAYATNRSDLLALGEAETGFALQTFQTVIPVSIQYATVPPDLIRAVVDTQPFAGGANAARTLQQWWSSLEAADAARIQESIQMGVLQGESVPQMVNRVRSTFELTRRNAEAIVRTGTNQIVTQARDAFHVANADILEALMWASTLDGRTTALCRARDGHFAPVTGADFTGIPEPHLKPPTARTPGHPGCRSTMTARLNSDGIADKMPDRPFVLDKRTRRVREIDFRAQAKAEAGDSWRTMSEAERRASISSIRRDWTKANVGTVEHMSYDTWMRKQPREFQDDVLGQKKGAAFRQGLKLDQFIDRSGNELTLTQLKDRFPEYIAG